MWIVMGLCIGIVIGFILPAKFAPPMVYSTYISISFLAGLDSVVGAIRGGIEGKFDLSLFVSGFLTNVLMAAFITWMGDRLGVDLYMAAIITFGVRLFNNLGFIRRDIVSVFTSTNENSASQNKHSEQEIQKDIETAV